jgi:hypothetical protein
MTSALDTLQAHVQAEALRVARVAAGDRARTLDNLLIMAARDHLLAEGLFRDGAQKAASDACKGFQAVATRVRLTGPHIPTDGHAVCGSLPGRRMAGAPMSTAHENVARRAVVRHLEKRRFLATISR